MFLTFGTEFAQKLGKVTFFNYISIIKNNVI